MVEYAGRAGSTTMPRDFTPYYARVMADIRAQIADGRLAPGEKLPTTAELAGRYGYSAGTIREAINKLIGEGLLHGHQGVGVFVAEETP